MALSQVGCKLNQAEIEALGRAFAAAGHEVVADLELADVHVVNTCTVTAEAARDSRRLARRGRAGFRPLFTVVTGCHATTHAEELRRIPGVDLVVSNVHKDELVDLVARRFPGVAASPSVPPKEVPRRRTRAAVKIQDGCSVGCAFCAVPAARGRERSRPVGEILAEVGELVAAGAQEIVLTGVQISAFHSEGVDLPALVEQILATTALRRLRLSSLAPWRVGPREVGMWRHRRLCRHVHLSLQSGCAATLKRMRRPCTPEQFALAVEELRMRIPGLAITTDVIVGFPGETEAEFSESLAFVAAMGFSKVHVFAFSLRPGTPAATLPNQLSPAVIRARARAMRQAAAAGQRAFFERYVGQRVEVLWESERQGWWEGHTDTYVPVRARAQGIQPNEWGWVEVKGVEGAAVWGHLLSPLIQPSLGE